MSLCPTTSSLGTSKSETASPDETGEWEDASRPYSTEGGKRIHTDVRRVDRPATVQDRTWIAHERISMRAPQRSLLA